MKARLHRIGMILIVSVISVFAKTHITGDLSGMSLDASGNPYIVEDDVLVPNGKKVIIHSGCVFLFKPFTGLHIQGDLNVEGTVLEPVVFTSINDTVYNPDSKQLPNPFDWNGILVTKEAGNVVFSNFHLGYSVYGIKSQNTGIKIENGLFKKNGQFHVAINEKIEYVQDDISFSYNMNNNTTQTKNEKVDVSSPTIETEDSVYGRNKKVIRYSSLGIGAVGIIAGTVFGIQAYDAYNIWSDESREDYIDTFLENEKIYKSKLMLTGISAGIGTLGLVGFGFTFVF